jgi:hypothetical protein
MSAKPAKRFTFRFSLRTLIISTGFLATYLAAWPMTKSEGVFDVYNHCARNRKHDEPLMPVDLYYAVAPFLVRLSHQSIELRTKTTRRHDTYYFWFFGGNVARLGGYERVLQVGTARSKTK